MAVPRTLAVPLGAVVTILVLGMVGPAVASPAPVQVCAPCEDGFTRAAAHHGLETQVEHSEATVLAARNGSATWTVSVVPTNRTALERLAENASLARDVAAGSFWIRSPGATEYQLLGAGVVDGAFVIRYRTHGVGHDGPLGTRVLTYFRDSPREYVYTDLGADELTVVAPPGMTVVRGFGDVSQDRMTATSLAGPRHGPFVIFAPQDHPVPGLLGGVALASVLWDVVAWNLVWFVVVPGGILLGGLTWIRREVDTRLSSPGYRGPWTATRLGGVVSIAGAVLLLLGPTTFRLVELLGAVLVPLGIGVGVPAIRQSLTGRRVVVAVVAIALGAAVLTDRFYHAGEFGAWPWLGLCFLPAAAVGLGWLDTAHGSVDDDAPNRAFVGCGVVVLGTLLVAAPLTSINPAFGRIAVWLLLGAVGVVVATMPLYHLGAAGAAAEVREEREPSPDAP